MMLYELVERDTLSMREWVYAWVWTWNDIKYGAGNKFYCNYVYMGTSYEIRTFHLHIDAYYYTTSQQYLYVCIFRLWRLRTGRWSYILLQKRSIIRLACKIKL